MKITVLGKSPSWQDAGGACSGYLIEHGRYVLLLDCGNSVFSKLRTVCDYAEVSAVLISHLHADHFLDLVPYSYALIHGPRQRPGRPRPRLYVPEGGGKLLSRVVGCWGNAGLIETAFEQHEYGSRHEVQLGPLRIALREVPHFTRTFAVDVSDGRGRLTFSADCAPNDGLVELATGTDLLLIEATLPEPESAGERGHMTAREAGEHGRRAAARRLVITHISDELDADRAVAEAQSGYGAPAEVAREGAVYTV
ncbi:MAG: MBL fold metallo-hydrolase [Solirubrobacterales bacterium]|nr:MBL fold metallo-hydrolase [Solirubrobacterales bacterium]